MKKIILTAAAILLSTGAFAQKHFEYGVKAGLNMAWSTNDFNNNYLYREYPNLPRPGISFGIFGEYRSAGLAGIQFEVLYSSQGSKTEIDGSNYTEKLDYIILPILIKGYFSHNSGWSIDIGPQVGYLVSAKVTESRGSFSVTQNMYNNEDLRKIDFSVCVGVSHKFPFGLDFSLRGTYGLTEVVDDSSSKHAVAKFSMGYRF